MEKVAEPIKISLAAARVNARKTQAQLAEEMEISRMTLANLENGKTQIVNPPNSLKEDVWFELQLIATAFSKCDIRMADKQEIKEKLEPYGRYREMGNDE